MYGARSRRLSSEGAWAGRRPHDPSRVGRATQSRPDRLGYRRLRPRAGRPPGPGLPGCGSREVPARRALGGEPSPPGARHAGRHAEQRWPSGPRGGGLAGPRPARPGGDGSPGGGQHLGAHSRRVRPGRRTTGRRPARSGSRGGQRLVPESGRPAGPFRPLGRRHGGRGRRRSGRRASPVGQAQPEHPGAA